jgi:hypothetical protein
MGGRVALNLNLGFGEAITPIEEQREGRSEIFLWRWPSVAEREEKEIRGVMCCGVAREKKEGEVIPGREREREREEKKERKEKKGRERNNLTLASVRFSVIGFVRLFA